MFNSFISNYHEKRYSDSPINLIN